MRQRPRRYALSLTLVVVTAACTSGSSTGTASSPTTPASPTTPTTSRTTTPTSTLPPVIDCPGGGEFSEGGGIAEIDDQGSDASRLGQISWETSDQCETFVFEFETSEGAPATAVPDIEVSHLDSYQILRIEMDVDSTVITDQLVETPLVERLYVVQGLEGGMFVDLHLAAPAAGRARADASPARLVLDLRPGFVEFAGAAATNSKVVVVSPESGAEVTPLTTLSGYSRTFEANVTIVATQGDAVMLETNTTAAGYVETWGEFRTELTLPEGGVSVFVGEASPADGSLDGVTIDVTVG